MVIYLITNKINGKQYVGQTVQPLENRWRYHLSKASGCLALKSAIDKYCKDNFEIKVIFEAKSLEELNKKEEELINSLNTLAPNGYNLKTGGDRPVFSDESRKRMSESHLGKKPSENARKSASERWKGKNNPNSNGMTIEHRAKLSLSAKSHTSNFLGHKHSAETKSIISEARKGKSPWNKGLTEADNRVASYIRKGENSVNYGKPGKATGYKHGQEDKLKWKYSNIDRFVKVKCNETGEVFESINEAARILGVRNGNISLVLMGKRAHTGGFTFSKVE